MTTRPRHAWLNASTIFLFGLGAACGGSPSESTEVLAPGSLRVSSSQLDLGERRSGTFVVSNPGEMAVGPVSLTSGPLNGAGGVGLPGSGLAFTPAEISTLNPGDGVTVEVRVDLQGTLRPGVYSAAIRLSAPSGGSGVGPVVANTSVVFNIPEYEAQEGVASVRFINPPGTLRQGDAITFGAEVVHENGTVLEGAPVGWEITPASAGFLGSNGQFVAYQAGEAAVIARAGDASDTITIDVNPRTLTATLRTVGTGSLPSRRTSDLWLFGDYAYTGTHTGGGGGNTMFTWDITDPVNPSLTDSLRIDARVVNDVKVNGTGTLAVITHEGSNDGANGVTLLDLSDPAHPTPIGRFTHRLETGVHNAWIDGDVLYLVADGTGVGLRILDVSDPSSPVLLSEFSGSTTTFLHDVYVRDGLAFLSHWNEGLVVLDVGNGMAGGTPTNPMEVSRIRVEGGQTHNAWYWPEAGYVFVGEEDFQTPGIMHVVDFRDPTDPREVATFRSEGTTPHNFWLDEVQGLLFMAWYGNGLRVLDVNGELIGELEKQGREVAGVRHLGNATCSGVGTCTWAPHLHRGLVYVTDMGHGLSALELLF